MIEANQSTITPYKNKPRTGWEDQFKAMAERKEDQLRIPDSIDLENQKVIQEM
nr:hypothetical protein [Leptospira vanthielii]